MRISCGGATGQSAWALPSSWGFLAIKGTVQMAGRRRAASIRAFSAAQARHPDTCGKCHMGPDHPQKEVYEESKHGIAFFANLDKMNMASPKWIVGEDYYSAPTCATCTR